MTNCYNPGWDLSFAKDEACKNKKCERTYDAQCMYNTQGQYVCKKITENQNNGWNFIMGEPYTVYKSDKSAIPSPPKQLKS